ncbi:hypothetical protein HUT16_03370 [Kitasatospora sp. NA04385]|uniref:hypothetical protein n=1 Tax=Kitasatospora sp. NA04385 TaxID=2742135 RepID=UPI0015909889|nr:hypothetical protein [Kitasatospora sp. NA04385]QKW18230.1 hypothetical protein HUT16_03370 [Kitasatospora sp. NA04385]
MSPVLYVPPHTAPEPAELADRTRAVLTETTAGTSEAPGPQGVLLVQAWRGGASYLWETPDQRECFATVRPDVVQERGRATRPLGAVGDRTCVPAP